MPSLRRIAALNVVEPYMSGVGGVGFLLLHLSSGQSHALNFCGPAPKKATPDQFTYENRERGPRSCLTPGNLGGWIEAHRQHGSLSLSQIFSPALALAREGFPLHPANAKLMALSLERLDEEGLRIYGGIETRIGAVLRQPELADTLEGVAADAGEDFYRGRLGRSIADHVQSLGGLLAQEDLKGLGHNTAPYLHLLSEAIKLAMADRIRWGSDPREQPVPLERLLNPDYIAARRRLIQYQRASQSNGGDLGSGRDTGSRCSRLGGWSHHPHVRGRLSGECLQYHPIPGLWFRFGSHDTGDWNRSQQFCKLVRDRSSVSPSQPDWPGSASLLLHGSFTGVQRGALLVFDWDSRKLGNSPDHGPDDP